MTETQNNSFKALTEQFEQWAQELQNLSPRSAYVKLEGKPAVKIKTLKVEESRARPAQLQEVLSTYRRIYQRTRNEAERQMETLALPLPAPKLHAATAPAYTRLFRSAENERSN